MNTRTILNILSKPVSTKPHWVEDLDVRPLYRTSTIDHWNSKLLLLVPRAGIHRYKPIIKFEDMSSILGGTAEI